MRLTLGMTAAALLFSTAALSSSIPQNGLLAHFSFDSDFSDSTGNVGTTPMGDLSLAPGQLGNAAYFDGNGDYLLLDTVELLGLRQNWTFSFLINFGQTTEPDGFPIYGEYGGSVSNNVNTRNFIDIRQTNLDTPNIIYDNFPPTGANVEDVRLSYDTWQAVSVIRRDDTVEFYVDGEFAASHPFVAYTGGAPLFATLGARLDSSGNIHTGRDLFGALDEALFYERALSEQEIAQIYAASGLDIEIVPTPAALTLLLIGAAASCRRYRWR